MVGVVGDHLGRSDRHHLEHVGLREAGAEKAFHGSVSDLGPALLNDWMVDQELANGQLVDVFPRYAVTATTFDTAAWLVYPSRSYLPGKVRAMIDFLRANLT